ncbi:unnamed protein product [Brugia timori]|uniref:Uncharacterized protein n=1 Tax=Brugia timori TaxID=42155 RepID=A0A0R3Q8Z4_9BILA|nr:unnamed protein product [Brugia timori]
MNPQEILIQSAWKNVICENNSKQKELMRNCHLWILQIP